MLATGAAYETAGAGAALTVGRLVEYDRAGAGATTAVGAEAKVVGAADATLGADEMVAGVVYAGEVWAANDMV